MSELAPFPSVYLSAWRFRYLRESTLPILAPSCPLRLCPSPARLASAGTTPRAASEATSEQTDLEKTHGANHHSTLNTFPDNTITGVKSAQCKKVSNHPAV